MTGLWAMGYGLWAMGLRAILTTLENRYNLNTFVRASSTNNNSLKPTIRKTRPIQWQTTLSLVSLLCALCALCG